jgi:hypothetical protein
MSWIIPIICGGIDVRNDEFVNLVLWRVSNQAHAPEEYNDPGFAAVLRAADEFLSLTWFFLDHYGEFLPGTEEAFNGPSEPEIDEKTIWALETQDKMVERLHNKSG